MTTPAVDSVTVLPGNGYTYKDSRLPTEFNPWPAGGILARAYTQRPASSTAPRLRGFKLCGPWSHKSGRFTFPSSSVVEVYNDRYPTAPYTRTWSGNLWSLDQYPAPQEPSSNLREACLVKALNKLKAQDFHLGNFVAESREAAHTIASTATRIGSEVEGFRKRFPKLWPIVTRLESGRLPRNRWCEIPSQWLALQYGWNPLLQDIWGACNHLSNRARFDLPYVEVRANQKSIELGKIQANTFALSGKGEVLTRTTQEVNTYLVYGMANPLLAELSSLGLINPLEIIWEVQKYSFVVDWVLPIGSWLSALSAGVGYDFITGGQSTKTSMESIGSRVVSYSTSTGDHIRRFDGPDIRIRSAHYTRSCYAIPPVPGLYVKNPFSAQHLANALSLLVQAFK